MCDQACGNLLCQTEIGFKKVFEFAERDEEFIKRTAFVLMVYHCIRLKKIDVYPLMETYLKLCLTHSDDNRIYVKKAISWAMRTIGKRGGNQESGP